MGSLATRSWAIIEPQAPELITEFQSNGTKVIALTALWPAIDKSLNLHIPNWRVKHLKAFGYDFSKSFPISCIYGFCGSDSQNTIEPYFKKGVMFSGEVPKATALLSFLRTISFKPQSVLFVDDNVSNVRSVYRELSRVGIECHSILYTRTQKFPPNSIFSQEEYNSCLKRQEESVKEFLRLEGIYMAQATEKINITSDTINTPDKSLTWLASNLAPSMPCSSSNIGQDSSLPQQRAKSNLP